MFPLAPHDLWHFAREDMQVKAYSLQMLRRMSNVRSRSRS